MCMRNIMRSWASLKMTFSGRGIPLPGSAAAVGNQAAGGRNFQPEEKGAEEFLCKKLCLSAYAIGDPSGV